jgi:hypothetical protein
MCVQCRRAVRAHDPEVLEPVIVRHTVHVVEDQRHRSTTPIFTLAAQFALGPFDSGCKESLFQMTSPIGRVFNEHMLQRKLTRTTGSTPSCVGIEVVGRDVPAGRILLDRFEV